MGAMELMQQCSRRLYFTLEVTWITCIFNGRVNWEFTLDPGLVAADAPVSFFADEEINYIISNERSPEKLKVYFTEVSNLSFQKCTYNPEVSRFLWILSNVLH